MSVHMIYLPKEDRYWVITLNWWFGRVHELQNRLEDLIRKYNINTA